MWTRAEKMLCDWVQRASNSVACTSGVSKSRCEGARSCDRSFAGALINGVYDLTMCSPHKVHKR